MHALLEEANGNSVVGNYIPEQLGVEGFKSKYGMTWKKWLDTVPGVEVQDSHSIKSVFHITLARAAPAPVLDDRIDREARARG